MLYGALEAGGTKMVCAVGDETGKIHEQVSIPTTTPDETMPKIIEYFKDKGISAIGIACFGPIDLDKSSETYGYITSTPKTAWKNFNIVGKTPPNHISHPSLVPTATLLTVIFCHRYSTITIRRLPISIVGQ